MSNHLRHRYLTGSGLSSITAFQGRRGFFSGVQRGTILITGGGTSNTATITTVDTNNCRLRNLGFSVVGAANENTLMTRILLTSATTITASLNTSGATNTTSSYEISSYIPGIIKQVQRGTFLVSGTATITTGDTTKIELDSLGNSTTSANSNILNVASIVLTNATTISGTSINSTATASYQTLEFF